MWAYLKTVGELPKSLPSIMACWSPVPHFLEHARPRGPEQPVENRQVVPVIEHVFADSGDAGERPASAACIAVEIVEVEPRQIGLAVQPRRRVVERIFAWINRNGRPAAG